MNINQKLLTITCFVVMILLGTIAYSTAKINQHNTGYAQRCNNVTTQDIFYAHFIANNFNQSKLEKKLYNSSSIKYTNRIVQNGTNIVPKKTEWYQSDLKPSKCAAKIYFDQPVNNGHTSAYVNYNVSIYNQKSSDNAIFYVQLTSTQWNKD